METQGQMTPKMGGNGDLVEFRLAVVEALIPRVKALEDGMSAFLIEYRTNEKTKEKLDSRRAKIHFALLTGLITFIIGCAIALFTWVLDGQHHIVQNDGNHPVAEVRPAPRQDSSNPPY